jgi:hypothetical protein
MDPPAQMPPAGSVGKCYGESESVVFINFTRLDDLYW